MGKYVIDPRVGLHIVANDLEVNADHELLAPTLFRSQTLTLAHEAFLRGSIDEAAAVEQLERLWKMNIRLLGDAVLRRTAWKIATEFGLPHTYDCEYFALTRLQGDAFVTMDTELTAVAQRVVAVAGLDVLL
jgi:predicted nucleic acid-binding protein